MTCQGCGKTVIVPMDYTGSEYCDDCVPLREFNPLGGAARGLGRCTCAAGPGTNPLCPVHP